MVTEKDEAEIAAAANRRGTSGCGVSDVRRARRGRKMSQFAGGRKDDEVAADDDST
jgi:hypothetical protein